MATLIPASTHRGAPVCWFEQQMADKDRSKFLLSAEAVPKVEIPKAADHELREFRLPGAMRSLPRREAVRDPRPTGGGEAHAEPLPSESAGGGQPSPARPEDARAEQPSDGARGAVAGRADSTLRFKDRTLGWFRAGEELEEEEASDEYEPEEAGARRALPVAVAIVALLVAIALVIWQLS